MDARKRASAFATAARKNLEVLSDSEYRSALDEIASYVVERSR
jgi:geranylgeranyl pyrophosphate synthase